MYLVQLDQESRCVVWADYDVNPDEETWIESPWMDDMPPANFDDYKLIDGNLVLDPRDLPPTKLSEADAVMAVLVAAPQILEAIPDDTLCHMAPYVPAWGIDVDYVAGDIRSYEERTYRCLQPHKSTAEWNPEDAPSLWARILPGQDGKPGEWVQPDSTNPYMKGDVVTHNGLTWKSDIDDNVWEPGVYGWTQLLEEE